MKSAIVALSQCQIAVVLAARYQAQRGAGDKLLRQLQPHFPTLPIMLIARDDTAPMGVSAYATFKCDGYLIELLTRRDIEWNELPPIPEQEPPF